MVMIRPVHPGRKDVQRLLAQSDKLASSLYPPESNHLASTEDLSRPHVLFLGASKDGQMKGCGAAKIMEDDGRYGEIKRMFVEPSARNRGIAAMLLRHLEAWLKTRGIGVVRLETGVKQAGALHLYRKTGFVETGPFGSHGPDPLSVFMEKTL